MNNSVVGTILPGRKIQINSCTEAKYVGLAGKIVAVYMKDGYMKFAVVLDEYPGTIIDGLATKDIKLTEMI